MPDLELKPITQSDWTYYVMGLAFILIAQVFKKGIELREENALTIQQLNINIMRNLTVHNLIKSIAYLSLVFFAFINPYLLERFTRAMLVYIEQQLMA